MKTFKEIEDIHLEHVAGSFSVFDMEALKTGLKRLKAGDTYVEVGTQNGRSIASAVWMSPKGVKFYAFDIKDAGTGPDTMSRKDFFEKFDLPVTFTESSSIKAACEWDQPIDMLFIDADHDFEEVLIDAACWTKWLKHGGYVYFHDADETSPGVVQVVEALHKSGHFDRKTYYKKTIEKNTSVASLRKKP